MFEVELLMHKGSVFSPLLFAVVVDVITDLAREGVLNKLWYADDLVLMSETIGQLWNMFIKWKEDFGIKRLKVNLGKINVMVSEGITMDG